VSKARAQARAARAAAGAQRTAAAEERRAKEMAERAKRERRDLAWRRIRLWQHGSGFRRNKERWAALGTLAMVLILLAFLLTDSFKVVLLVVLVLIVGGPALVMLTFDRRSK
jgi:Flp pilus assembly protein TadB